MRLALITVHYPPIKSSCAVQMKDLAHEFLNQGHNPVVITPDHELKESWAKETHDSIDVYRLKCPIIIDINNFRRAINETLMPFIMLYNLRKTPLNLSSFDGVIWYSPSIFFGPLVWYLKIKSSCKTYLILRDIFPEWAIDLDLMNKSPIYYFFKLVAKLQYCIANTIGVQSKSDLNYFNKQPEETKTEVLSNWISEGNVEKSSINLNLSKLKERKILIYVGNMGVAQGLQFILDLVLSMKNKSEIGFVFVGRGSMVDSMNLFIKEHSLENILRYDQIPSAEIKSLLGQANIGLVSLDSRHKANNIPGKFLSYLQAGIPTLAKINKDTDLEETIEIKNVGKVYTGDSVKEFEEILEGMINSQDSLVLFSENSKVLAVKEFSSFKAAKQIVLSLENAK